MLELPLDWLSGTIIVFPLVQLVNLSGIQTKLLALPNIDD